MPDSGFSPGEKSWARNTSRPAVSGGQATSWNPWLLDSSILAKCIGNRIFNLLVRHATSNPDGWTLLAIEDIGTAMAVVTLERTAVLRDVRLHNSNGEKLAHILRRRSKAIIHELRSYFAHFISSSTGGQRCDETRCSIVGFLPRVPVQERPEMFRAFSS